MFLMKNRLTGRNTLIKAAIKILCTDCERRAFLFIRQDSTSSGVFLQSNKPYIDKLVMQNSLTP